MSSATFFIIFNLIAGGLNYLFQVIASTRLSASGYAQLNTWYANLAIFFLLSGVIQYSANFFPVEKAKFRVGVILCNVICLLVLIWPATADQLSLVEWGVVTLIISVLFGWLSGQIQNRMMFYTLGTINLLAAVTRLSVASFSLDNEAVVEQFIFASFISTYPAIIFASVAGWFNQTKIARSPSAKPLSSLWTAPLIMSYTTLMIPQMDILILKRTQISLVFEQFVRAGLFARGVFFLFLIIAQWLLPRQIRSASAQGNQVLASKILYLIACFGAALISLFAPIVIKYVLKWNDSPSLETIFLSSWNMALLTWIYLLVQDRCAKGKPISAIYTSMVITGFAFIQLLLKLDLRYYFVLSIGILHLVIFYLTNELKNKSDLHLAKVK